MSRIPQGSVLGPILFVVFINDMPDFLCSMCQLFADDAKIFRGILSKEHVSALQEDLGRLDEWSEKWQLAFKVHKWINVSHFILEQEIHITNAK